jgi:hypothetical protein
MGFEQAFYLSAGIIMVLATILYITFKITENGKSFWVDIFKLLMVGVSIAFLLLIPYSFISYENELTPVINHTIYENSTNTTFYYYTDYNLTTTSQANNIFYLSYTWFVYIFASLMVPYIFYSIAVYFGWIKIKTK